jgi:hypothetical protein
VPARLGFSLKDYYELAGKDHAFGYGEVGGLATLRLAASQFGVWSLHGGVDVYVLGDTTKSINRESGSKTVASIGLGVTY